MPSAVQCHISQGVSVYSLSGRGERPERPVMRETIRLNGRTVLLTLPLLERIEVTIDAAARLTTSESRWK